jgi:hypothetical protein
MGEAKGSWKIGLGASNQRTLIVGAWPSSLLINTVIANLPHAIFSVIYFSTNAVFTSMTLASEWSQYAVNRKGLRVSSSAESLQRNSYFLSLPFRYALPLMAASATLHWLISQSIFLVGIDAYTSNYKRDPDSDVSTCGYSPTGVISVISVGILIVISIVGFSFKRLKSGMPVAGSCSLAIAAACHPVPVNDSRGAEVVRQTEDHPELFPLKWGVMSLDSAGGFGHCGFSSREVEMPVDGEIYK